MTVYPVSPVAVAVALANMFAFTSARAPCAGVTDPAVAPLRPGPTVPAALPPPGAADVGPTSAFTPWEVGPLFRVSAQFAEAMALSTINLWQASVSEMLR